MSTSIQSRIDLALDYLVSRQLPTGEIDTQCARDPALSIDRRSDSCVFTAAVAGCCLRLLGDHPPAVALLRRAQSFLLQEHCGEGMWRYWTKRSGRAIDPDVDDTALAGFVVSDVAPDITQLSRSAILNNRDAQGHFLTWIRSGTKRNDIDSVVNANAILLLRDSTEVGDVCRMLVRLLRMGEADRTHRYYPSLISPFHAISRAYAWGAEDLAPAVDIVISSLSSLQREDGTFGDVLDTALAVSALSYVGHSGEGVDRALRKIMEGQRRDGSWAACAYYAGPEPPNSLSVWFGSDEMTTLICVEALALQAGYGPAWKTGAGLHAS